MLKRRTEREPPPGALPALDRARDALFLDIDGTIVDIAPTPDAVCVPESLKRNLSRLNSLLEGAIALVSGRTLASIDELLAPIKLAAVGCHGAEIRRQPGDKIETHGEPLSASIKAAFADTTKLDPRIRLEDKHYTFAIHYRRAPELENVLFGMVNARLSTLDANLEVICGKAVIEIKEPGFNKGTGLMELMSRAPFHGRRPIYFGDDSTDEDAFAVLAGLKGLGISVGRLLPGAASCVSSPADVREWLARSVEGA
jgi:trehalose 6-phosphate phosphatase